MERIALATTDAEIDRCHAVMSELRPHIPRTDFLARVRRQERGGYLIAFLEDAGQIKAVAGFRISECLAWGKFLYVDDLVTASGERSKGYGDRLLDWLKDRARQQGCAELHLDSGVQRHQAHRFYLRKGMAFTCQHFALEVRTR